MGTATVRDHDALRSRAGGGGAPRALPWYLPDRADSRVDVQALYGALACTLDFETTNKDHGDAGNPANRVVCASVRVGGARAWCEEWTPQTKEATRTALASARVLVAHNAQFELAWLRREGLPCEHLLVWDTMLGERVIHTAKTVPVGLDAACKRWGLPAKAPLVAAMMTSGVCPSEIPWRWLRERCLRDVETTHALFERQRDRIAEEGKLGVMLTRCVLVPPLVEIAQEGVDLDRERVYDEYTRVLRELADTTNELRAMCGAVNLRSPKQKAELIYKTLGFDELTKASGKLDRRPSNPLWPEGQPKTDAKTLAKLKPRNKLQRRFLELQRQQAKLDARLTKCLYFYKGVVDDYGGHFRAEFHQTRTETHRLSSTARKLWIAEFKKELGAQLQNQPREYKKLFRSPDSEYRAVEVDGAQLEFRVAAFLGQDRTACAEIVAGKDIHRFSAAVLGEVDESAVTDAMRQAAKAETFKPLYGGRYGSPAQMRYYEAFRKKYSGITRAQAGWLHEVLKTKRLRMPWGMEFPFPDARMDDRGYCRDEPSVCNYPVQNLATAEIIPVSLTYLYWRCKLLGLRVKFVNTVHDSVVALVHHEDVEEYVEAARLAFLDDTYTYLDAVYGLQMNVPLGLGVKVGEHWGEGVERKFSAPYAKVPVLSEE